MLTDDDKYGIKIVVERHQIKPSFRCSDCKVPFGPCENCPKLTEESNNDTLEKDQ